ncbi:MAG: DUF4426 domain-containing protein [Cellvibrionaceae bacterium]|nr:DUF4426 domain-containing protein [Cellvibrionaceae bacterium]
MSKISKVFAIISLFFCSHVSLAQEGTSYELDEHMVYHNVFNSTLIPADVAKVHKLVRSKNRVYVNIAVVKKTGGNGIPAQIKGWHRNLIQQKFPLEFITISEADATYYLAPIRINNEDILHIDIQVQLQGESDVSEFTITKKLYLE